MAEGSSTVSKEVTITRGQANANINQPTNARNNALTVNVPSLPADRTGAEVIDKTLPVQLMDVQLSDVFQGNGTAPPTAAPQPSSPKRIMIGSRGGSSETAKPRETQERRPAQISVSTTQPAMNVPYQPPTPVIKQVPQQAIATAASPNTIIQTSYVPPKPVAPVVSARLAPPRIAEPVSVASFMAALSALGDSATQAVTNVSYVAPQTLASLAPAAGPETAAAPAPLVATSTPETLPEPVSGTAKTDYVAPIPAEPQQVLDQALQTAPAPAAPVEATPAPAAETPPPVAAEPAPKLSKESKKTLSKIPAGIDTPKDEKTEQLSIDRAKEPVVTGTTEVKSSHETLGLKIEVRKPTVDINYELEKAYSALVAGEPSVAVEIYRRALDAAPESLQAKLGLAIAHHRAGQLDIARPLYADVLQKDPSNRDALNNFLGLVAEESPDEALGKLQVLMTRNPDFSPIPAQMAFIYQKKGDLISASQSMLKAVSLAPENLSYKYNLAVIFDRLGKKEEASSIYSNLLDAYMRGENLGVNVKAIQERLTFLRSNRG